MNKSAKLVLITGVSRGLGKAMTEEFIAQGHVVIGCARSEDAVAQLRSAFAAPHRFDTVNTANPEQVNQWANSVVESCGTPDIIINNAAIINPNAPLWEVDEPAFSQLIDVNIKGVFNVIKAFLPALLKANSGTLVNLSSGWGRSVSADVASYCASKWAIEGMTQALALDLPDPLVAVPLNPGVINTDMLQSCFGEQANNCIDTVQWAKIAVPFILAISKSDNGKPLTVPA